MNALPQTMAGGKHPTIGDTWREVSLMNSAGVCAAPTRTQRRRMEYVEQGPALCGESAPFKQLWRARCRWIFHDSRPR